MATTAELRAYCSCPVIVPDVMHTVLNERGELDFVITCFVCKKVRKLETGATWHAGSADGPSVRNGPAEVVILDLSDLAEVERAQQHIDAELLRALQIPKEFLEPLE